VVIAAVLAAALAVYLSRLIGRPLNQLLDAVGDLLSDRSRRVDIRTGDELQSLGAAFNRMAENLDATTVSRDYLDSIFASMLDGLLVIGRDGRIELANHAASDLLGTAPDSLRGRLVRDLLHLNGDPLGQAQPPRSAAGEGLLRGALQSIPVLYSLAQMQDSGDRYVLALRDIRERKRKEADLRAAKEAAEAGERIKTEFLTNISHEIRTPLNGVIGMLQLLQASPQDDEQREYTRVAHRSAETLLQLLNDILDLSRMNAGKLPVDSIPFQPRTVAEEVCELFTPLAVEKNLEIICLVHTAVPRAVTGDPVRLRQVLVNLVGNAVKFTELGEVVLELDYRMETDGSPTLLAHVRDTGIGIGPEVLGRLFEPFTQADGSTTRRHGGTGLGLAVCRLLVEAMHGTIGVSSVRGDGSTFWFTARFGRVEEENDAAVAARELEGLSVLIVVDNQPNRLILSRETASWAMEPSEAAGGQEALELASAAFTRGDPFDLVLLDMLMPGMDGLEVAASFAADPALATIPIIMLTSAVGPDEEPLLEQHGIMARLSKPVRRQQLLECILRVLHSHAPWGRHTPLREATRRSTDSRRVLVVEDNVVNQKVAVRMLERLGYRADVAANGLEACHAVDRMPYGAILMDCQMPVMDGFKATAEIRRRMKEDDRIPIIAMTAHAMVGDRERMLEADMDDYLSKPVLREDLAEMLERWLPQPETDEATSSGETMTTMPHGGPHPAIDPSALDELRQLDEGAEILGELIDIYLEDTPQRLEALAKAVAEGDAVGIREHAHSLKSSCAQLGAAHLSDLCRQLETLGRDGDLGPTASLMAEAQAEFPRVQEALAAEKAGA
jgi:signal transduction histidine kinase/CheY-like chemotaxis protein/HPt (histidine-containing phosphotransfer) domain-containing protein